MRLRVRGLLMLVVLLLAACSAPEPDSGSDGASNPPSQQASTQPVEPVEPEPRSTLPPAQSWRAGPGEVLPEVKETATGLLQRAGTWSEPGGGSPEGMADRLSVEEGATTALTAGLTPLQASDAVASTVSIVYPQYGGLNATASSVMTIISQRLLDDAGRETSRELVMDVRLTLGPEGWMVDGIVQTTPSLAGDGRLGPAALAVLHNPNVRLPAAAEADLRTGALDEEMLTILDGIAADHVVDVTVFYAGHPTNVFGTDRVSNHHVGRAVDIWAVDGRAIVSATEDRAFLDPVLLQAAELGATEVGAPYDLNGPGAGFFTDQVHQDHLHIGVSVGRPPAQP